MCSVDKHLVRYLNFVNNFLYIKLLQNQLILLKTLLIIYLLQNMFFLHMRYRQELRSRIAAQYLESRIRSKIDKTHITPLGEKAISPNDWLTYPRDPYHP